MSLVDKLKSDVNEAVKAKDSLRVETLRGIVSSIQNEEIALRSKSSDIEEKDILRVVQKEAKKRKESMEVYSGAGRDDLAEKEKLELEIISTYLPEEISEEEVKNIVKEVIESVGSDDFGKIMQSAMAKVSGRAEARVVSEIVKSFTENK